MSCSRSDPPARSTRRTSRTAPATSAKWWVALGEVPDEEVAVERRKVEAAGGLVHQGHPVGVRMLAQLILDPPHRLLDRRLACRHPRLLRPSPGARPHPVGIIPGAVLAR